MLSASTWAPVMPKMTEAPAPHSHPPRLQLDCPVESGKVASLQGDEHSFWGQTGY